MNNLPITSAPQTAAAPKQSGGTPDNADTQNSQPFGAVLARQTNGQAAKDTKDAKANDKDVQADDRNVIDTLAQLGTDPRGIQKLVANARTDAAAIKTDTTDTKETAAPAGDANTLPANMLAAMLAQAMAPAAAAPSATATGAKPDGLAVNAGVPQEQRGPAAMKTEALASLQAGLAPKTDTNLAAQVEAQSFAAVRETLAASQPANAAALASMQQAAATIAAPALQPAQATVNTPITQDKWSDEFSQKITWLASSKQDQTAELHLNPPQLGPVDVVLKVSGDQATALFTSPHAAVREAIEQAMPKLRDMLADNGIMLGNATVSDQTPRDQGQSAARQTAPTQTGNDLRDTAVTAGSTLRVSPIARHNGIVDTFA